MMTPAAFENGNIRSVFKMKLVRRAGR